MVNYTWNSALFQSKSKRSSYKNQ